MADTEAQKKHKMLMDTVIALAVIHALLSAVVAYLVQTNSPLLQKIPNALLIFLGISVVVNIIILILASMCKNTSM
jgi:hypothetical protein